MGVKQAIQDATLGSALGPVGTIGGAILGLLSGNGGGGTSAAKSAVMDQAINGTQNALAPTITSQAPAAVGAPASYTQAAGGYQGGIDSLGGSASTSAMGGSGQGGIGDPGVSAPPMINANAVASNQVDPQLAQAILDKVAAGQPLAPAEKLAIGKLPPSLIQHAAMSGTAPMAPGTPNVPASTKEGQPVGQDVGGRSFGAPMGNSAESQGLLPSMHYSGIASYGDSTKTGSGGSTMSDPVQQTTQSGSPAVAAPAVSAASLGTPPPTTNPQASQREFNAVSPATSPTVQIAQAVAASPNAPPSLKGMKGQDIAKMIGSVLDVVGVGLSARGGVTRQTMLQHQIQLGQETQAKGQQTQAQAAANVTEAQGESQAAINQALTLLPPQTKANIETLVAKGKLDEAMAKLLSDTTLDNQVKIAAAGAIAAQQVYLKNLQTVSTVKNQPITGKTAAEQEGAHAADAGASGS